MRLILEQSDLLPKWQDKNIQDITLNDLQYHIGEYKMIRFANEVSIEINNQVKYLKSNNISKLNQVLGFVKSE